jgi:hypothetical protein
MLSHTVFYSAPWAFWEALMSLADSVFFPDYRTNKYHLTTCERRVNRVGGNFGVKNKYWNILVNKRVSAEQAHAGIML